MGGRSRPPWCTVHVRPDGIDLGQALTNLNRDANTWELTSEDLSLWEEFLAHNISKALDFGVDAFTVLDNVALLISQHRSPTSASSLRVADLLLTQLEVTDAREVPKAVFEFVNDTLGSAYPPEPRNTLSAMWMSRSLLSVIEACPQDLVLSVLEVLQVGLSLWIADEFVVWTEQELTYDVS